ncbi:MAG: SixA phosphatase family protein [Phycisphaerales bacterium JB040]
MILTIARHGKAHQYSESGTDRDRELKPRGHRQAEFLGRALATLETPPDRLVSSPFVRAHQTATLLNAALDLDLLIDDRLRCGQPASSVLDCLEANSDAASLVLVGHNPTFDDVIGLLLHGPGSTGPGLRTGEAFVLRIQPDQPVGTAELHAQFRLEKEEAPTP